MSESDELAGPLLPPSPDLADYVHRSREQGQLVVQPRMGTADAAEMAAGLRAVAAVQDRTVCTLTLDSYTRVGDHRQAREALRRGDDLNGFPLVVHGPAVTAAVAAAAGDRPVQVRHGSAQPLQIFRTLAAAGLSASEGGPVSYCLPYGRVPLAESVARWRDATAELAGRCEAAGRRAHLESFGGCLLGQLCPPSLLVAVSLLEGMFFAQQGIRSLSLSYAQQTDPTQDVEALTALRQLADELLPPEVDRHLVLYTYMGVFPSTPAGAGLLMDRSARLAVHGGADRLIVKTRVESSRLPTFAENVSALQAAADTARATVRFDGVVDHSEVLAEARALVEAVLGLSDDIGKALLYAFALGLLDVPFCLHADNRGLTQGTIDGRGRLAWASVGKLPLPARPAAAPVTSDQLLGLLRHTADRHDLQASEDLDALDTLDTLEGLDAVAVEGLDPLGGLEAEPPAEPYRIVLVGAGPRGVSVLERLAARLAEEPPNRPVELCAVDAVQVGPGRIWRTDQPHWSMMNTPAGEVTMFSGPPDGGPTRAGAGPSLLEWWRAFAPEEAHPHAYAPRALHGEYLRYVLTRVEHRLPEGVRLRREYGNRVLDVRPAPDGRYRVELENGPALTADRVVLATGHAVPELQPEQQRLADFADSVPGLRFLRGDAVTDMALDTLAPGAPVGVLGLGLSFYDVMAALTTGRGGEYAEGPAGRLRYLPSGEEPLLVAGSRSGVPLPARGVNQKPSDWSYRPVLFTRERMAAARARGRLDFRADVLPWLLAEVELVYCATELRRRFGPDTAARFTAQVRTAAADTTAPRLTVALISRRYDLAGLLPIDLDAWARPFAGRSFDSPAHYQRALAGLLHQDLERAGQGNLDGPVKAALDTMRDVRSVLRSAVEFDGLTPESHREDFLRRFGPVASSLTTGPPRIRLQQVLALLEAGVLRIVGPDVRFGTDPGAGRFTVESPQVVGSRTLLDAVIDARIPEPDLRRAPDGLLARLRDAGMLTHHVNRGPDGSEFATGGVDLTVKPFHPLRADGLPERGMYVIGIPTEFTRWFTQVGSGRPGHWGEFTADADAIAEDALHPLRGNRARTLPGVVLGERWSRVLEAAAEGEG